MKLEKFTKNKKQKGIVIGSIVGILLLIGGISIYRTFAMYKVEKTFDVLNGTVPNFSSGDLQLAITVDGKKEETIPTKNDKNYGVVVECDNAKGSWDKENWNAILGEFIGSKVKCNLYFESTLSGYIKALSKVDESIIEEEHEATEQTPKLIDYRYVGATPNNYVCLEEEGSCDENNLYRIIGVIPTQKEESEDSVYEDRVKLIKNTFYTSTSATNPEYGNGSGYSWSGSQDSNSNDWAQSTLNTKILNEEYWQSISLYQKYIEKAKWYLGGISNTNVISNYKQERNLIGGYSNKNLSSYISFIGLMYASDYGYATSGGNKENRVICLNAGSYNAEDSWSKSNYCGQNDWLYQIGGYYFLTLSVQKDDNRAYMVHDSKAINSVIPNQVFLVKPSFYLKVAVLYKSGDGTHENPYRISIAEN